MICLNHWQNESSGKTISRSTSQEVELPSSTRKQTPVRAVFHDLQSAHSSITSGHARTASGRHAIPANLSAPLHEVEAIPLRDLERKRGATVASFLQNIPLPPPPIALSHGRYDPDAEHNTPVPRAKSQQRLTPADKEKPATLFTNIKNALANISSPITPEANDTYEAAAQWPRDNLGDGKGKKTRDFLVHLKESDEASPFTSEAQSRKAKGFRLGGGEKSSVANPDNDSSIYHSSLGEAPSGSLLPSSRDDGSPRNVSHINPYRQARHSLYTPFYREGESLLRKSVSDEHPKRHSYDIQRATSTVGDIYKHYVHSSRINSLESDSEDDVSEQSPLRGDIAFKAQELHRALDEVADLSSKPTWVELRPSALNIRKQRRAGRLAEESQPPEYTLPQLPNAVAPNFLSSTTQDLGRSSSYGDTRKLLDLTQPVQSTPRRALENRTNGLKADEDDIEEDIMSQFPIPNLLATPNIYTTPKVVISPADDLSVYGDDPHWEDPIMQRQPLEREVSEALRRASGYSAYSRESISTSVLSNHEHPHLERNTSKGKNFSRRFNIEATPPSDAGSLNSDQREFAAQAQAFYDRGAIPQNWITAQHQNVVRIPISHSGQLPDSPPESPQSHQNEEDKEEIITNEQDDLNDWETVGESAAGAMMQSRQNTPSMMGGLVNRAGSSIADISDDGTESTDAPHIDEYRSSDRIAQHPGNIQYYGEYRQRDLKKTHIPVFLPVFREHKINGYLADSNRFRPPQNFYNYNPQPLGRAHINPFKAPPPEVMKHAQKPSSRGRKINLFPPSLHTSEESADFTRPNQNLRKSPKVSKVDGQLRFDWTEKLDGLEPQVTTVNEDRPDSVVSELPSSWKYALELGEKDDDSTQDLPLTTPTTQNTKDGEFNDAPVTGGLRNQFHQPLVKGPPGAFYRDLRSTSKHEPKGSLCQANRPAKAPIRNNSTKGYPTNTLRPLTLLASTNCPSTSNAPSILSQTQGPEHNKEIGTSTFVYRSPLAPPKRPSWQDLYSTDQLKGMQDAAKLDGFFESQPAIGNHIRGNTKGNTWKHLFESPKLSPWSRDPSNVMFEARRKRTISITVLILCNFFPPLLFLYASGYMDGLMMWWTEGDFATFALRQKNYAWLSLACWGLATFVGLVAFLVVFFTRLRG
ncbi:hypothetical protein ACMFMF_009589 [Clarireedia jacksonii]